MKKISVSKIIIVLLCAAILVFCGITVAEIISAKKEGVGKQSDQTADINVMLVRPDNWRKIASVSLLERKDFAGIDGSTATIPITAELARQFCNAKDNGNGTLSNMVISFVNHNKTDVAYENLIYKNNNSLPYEIYSQPVRLVFATPPSEDEYRMAAENGVTLEAEQVALDGFVFITNKNNPVDSLTVEQIRDIYAGKITNWKQVGGRDEEIRAFQRSKNSGSQTAMEELVMQGTPMQEAPAALKPELMSSLVRYVAEYENLPSAIGYTYYYYINNLYKNTDIKVLKINGISPDNENLIDNTYPFTAGYYAVIRGDEPEDSVYRKLRDYMLSDEGQEIIALAGYCPIKELPYAE